MPLRPSKSIESFPNPHPNNDYTIRFESREFTTLCPMTGQPDFAQITVEYKPGPRCLESKSIKQYLWSFRDEGHFHEAVTNQILDELVGATKPRYMRVEGDFFVRGGISTRVTVTHDKAKRKKR